MNVSMTAFQQLRFFTTLILCFQLLMMRNCLLVHMRVICRGPKNKPILAIYHLLIPWEIISLFCIPERRVMFQDIPKADSVKLSK